MPADFAPGQPLALLFGAADEDAEVWLNGQRVGEHTCASTGLAPEQIWTLPFSLDVGTAVRREESNLLAVRVYNRRGMGGVWKPVYLYVPSPATANLDLTLAALQGQRGR